MTPRQAWLYAATWGSYMTGGDPGAVMYGFDERFAVQDEGHRADVLAWIAGCVADVAADPARFAANEVAKLEELRAAVEAAPVDGAPRGGGDAASRLAAFVGGTIEAAVFTATDSDGEPPPEDVSEADFEPGTLRRIKADAAAFYAEHAALIVAANLAKDPGCGPEAYAGHDFWLTRCGHGAGFWDGDWREPAATTLSEAARACGNVDLVYEGGRLAA